MVISCRERSNRNLTLILSILLIITNTVSAAVLHALPADPLSLAFHLALYSAFGALMSVLGLVGVLQRNATLLLIFSNQLLLDAILSTLPRLLLLALSFSLPAPFCASLSQSLAALTTATTATASSVPPPSPLPTHLNPASCVRLLWVVEVLLSGVIVGLTALQWVCAWRVRECARACEAGELLRRRGGGVGVGCGHVDFRERGRAQLLEVEMDVEVEKGRL